MSGNKELSELLTHHQGGTAVDYLFMSELIVLTFFWYIQTAQCHTFLGAFLFKQINKEFTRIVGRLQKTARYL